MDELECLKATATRLIGQMRNFLDAPIEYDRARNGYFYDTSAAHPYELPGLWFNNSELYALLTAQALLEQVDPGLYSEQIRPLGERIRVMLEKAGHKDDESARRIRILSLARRRFDNHLFRHIASATLERKRLRICYHGRGDDNRKEREISPQRLVHYRNNWYLDAWCHASDGYRTFAVERIEQAQHLMSGAKAISEQVLDEYYASAFGIFSGKAEHTAVLHFTPERARWVAEEEWHPNQTTHWLDDGRFELCIPYGNPTELIMDILKYGTDVEVVAPISLRRQVVQRIQQMAALYA